VHLVIYDNDYPTRCNNLQFVYICKLLYVFRVVSPPIIRSSCRDWMGTSSHPVTYTTSSSNGLINARYCRYSDMRSWWWVEIPPETCRAVVPIQSRSRQVADTVSLMPDTVDTVIWDPDDGWRYHPKRVEKFTDTNKLYIVASCWIIIATNEILKH